jgi:chromosome segregation ATPase
VPCFGSEDTPGRDTLLFKCREAIESLQDEIEDHQKALNERDYLLCQGQEREEELIKTKKSAFQQIELLNEKLVKLKNEMKDNEDRYENDYHRLIEESKKLKLENIEMESKNNKYQLRLESIEETVSDLKFRKNNLESSNEKLEVKIKDLKTTVNEYESANQLLDSKLIWAEKTHEEGISKMMSEYEMKEQFLHRQNNEILERTQNEKIDKEARIKAEMKEKIMGIQKGIEVSNNEIKKLRDEKQQLLDENMKLTQMLSDIKVTQRSKVKE